MATTAHEILQDKANIALGKAAKRVADLRFFEQIMMRINAGEDMSKQLDEFALVDKKTAIATLKLLIKRCKDDLKKGDWEFANRRIVQTKVVQSYNFIEHVPNYKVEYTIKTKLGIVVARLENAGPNVAIYFDTKACKGVAKDAALIEVFKYLQFDAMYTQ
jgi:hypothetical protein